MQPVNIQIYQTQKYTQNFTRKQVRYNSQVACAGWMSAINLLMTYMFLQKYKTPITRLQTIDHKKEFNKLQSDIFMQ